VRGKSTGFNCTGLALIHGRFCGEQTDLSSAELEQVRQQLAQWDARSQHGPWTMMILRLIQDHPKTRAADLADLISPGDSGPESQCA
jgi:hypothetical protein